MEKMQDLKDLLQHEIQDLYSAETQLIEALPKMAENATNPELKKALQQHLRVTEIQKNRLDQISNLFGKDAKEEGEEKSGLLSRLFGGSKGEQKCIGMEAIIEEGEKIMGEEMNSEVMDAAIIGAAQKAEHYEICGYGTCKAYARELELGKIAELLDQTLNEEYEADDRLTELAVGGLNEEADKAGEKSRGLRRRGNSGNSKSATSKGSPVGRSKTASKSSSSSIRGGVSKSSDSKAASKKATASKSNKSGRSSSKTASKASTKSSGGRSTKTASKNTKKAATSRSKSSSRGRK
ncbi:MAG: ferritin-like domain-containing protein [Bacteroidota bacterium]|nr:ferritin-like domain-containing protein [Bacteroidota bacterium]